MKAALLHALERARLLRPAYRAYEAAKLLRPERALRTDDGLPLPPRRLIVRVTGKPDRNWFLESGQLAAGSIRMALMRHGLRVEEFGSLLDFGCGCGRVVRTWRSLPDTAVHGTDYSPDAVAWCRANLAFASFDVNGLEPPLPHADASFDFVYALSVFTHLPDSLQHRWVAELRRVLRPEGVLLLTTHGAAYRRRLSPDELARFDADELVVRWGQVAGTNLCAAFHPERYVRERLADGFDVLDFAPEGAKGNPEQDQYLLRRR